MVMVVVVGERGGFKAFVSVRQKFLSLSFFFQFSLSPIFFLGTRAFFLETLCRLPLFAVLDPYFYRHKYSLSSYLFIS